MACKETGESSNSPPTMLTFSSSSSSPSASTSDPQPQQTNPNQNPEQEAEPEAAYKLIPSLPDDVALNCLARVPWCHHRTLSLVSKPMRSLLSSPLFFNTRSMLHTTQPVLYLSLQLRHSSSQQWFALPLINPLATTLPLPLPPIPSPTFNPSYALLGHDIYVIGGFFRGICSPLVWVLDCRCNRWRQGPTMLVPRKDFATAVLDGMIYVMGGCKSHIWVEVLDPAVGRWEEVVSPFNDRTYDRTWVPSCGAVGGKLYMGRLAYDPRNRVWERRQREAWFGREGSACSVDGVLYSCCDYSDTIKGLEVGEVREREKWKEVKGLDLDKVLPLFRSLTATLASAAGKLFLVWTREWDGKGKQHEVWSSQIEVHRNNEDRELWGKLCWSQKIPFGHYAVKRSFAVDM